MATEARPVQPAAFRKLTRSLIGLPVARVWQSFDWTLFLELGRLTWEPYPKKLVKRGRWVGQAGVMLDGGWRIEREDGILADARSRRSAMRRAVRSLQGLKIKGVGVEGRLPELSIEFTGGRWVRSLTAGLEETRWGLCLEHRPERSVWLAPRGRKLVREVNH